MIAIIGGGFALYGYLPAAIRHGYKAGTLRKYKNFLDSRIDLKHLLAEITFYDSEEDLINHSSHVVYARRPIDQYNFLKNNLPGFLKNKFLFLEKPLSFSSNSSLELLSLLKMNNSQFRIGFIFQYTNWFKDVTEILKRCSEDEKFILEIDWNFNAFHYRNKIDSWKRDPNLGGGAFLFYGSHIVNMIASIDDTWSSLNLVTYHSSINDEYKFCAHGVSSRGEFRVNCNARNSEETGYHLKISKKSKNIYNLHLADPFERDLLVDQALKEDDRINFLLDILNSTNNAHSHLEEYERTFSLLDNLNNIKQIKYD